MITRSLRARLEKLEQAVQPRERLFVMSHDGIKPLDEQIAAFKVQHGVTARDLLVISRCLRFSDDEEPAQCA